MSAIVLAVACVSYLWATDVLRKPPEALHLFQALDALSAREGFSLNIGPALQSDADDPAQAELLGQILAATAINASVIVAAEDGIHWKSIRSAAKVMKYLEDNSPRGENNFDFAATAMLSPYTPFFPGSYHDGPGRQFSVGLEAANFVADTFEVGKLQTAQARLSDGLAEQARFLDAIAQQIQKTSGWTYLGLDATPAPNLDSSIGAAIEKVTGEKFGSAGNSDRGPNHHRCRALSPGQTRGLFRAHAAVARGSGAGAALE